MATMFRLTAIVSYFVILTQANKMWDSLKSQFEEITHYELIHFDNLDSLVVGNPTNILEFDAFGQHFSFKLTLRDNAPLVINHPQRSLDLRPAHEYELCHYKGEVIEPSHSGIQYVSVSFCSERGVRAFITLHNESLFIHPAAHHFDPHHDPPNGHQLHDTHLIYKHSTNYPSNPSVKRRASKLLSKFETQHTKTRRRLPHNTQNSVELYLMVDPSYCDEWKEKSSWYNKMFNWVQDFVNAASDEYERCDWGYNSGEWEIKWVRLDVVESYSGEFRGMKYDYDSDEYDGRDEGSGYRRLFRDWSRKNVDQEFDFGGIYTYQGDGGGAAWKSGVCGSNKFMNSQSDGNAERQRKLLAHELGHCLGMDHDENEDGDDDYTCPDGDIMGDGDHNSGWSSCSKKYLRDFMEKENGLSCTRESSDSLRVNRGDGDETNVDNGDDDDDDNSNNNNNNNGGSSGDCVRVSSLYMNGNRLDGDYFETGTRYGGKKSYRRKDGSKFLYKLEEDNDWYWTISSNLGRNEWKYGWCDRTDIESCDDDWEGYDGSDDDCSFSSCGGLEEDVDACLEGNKYTDAICFYENGFESNKTDDYVMYTVDIEHGCTYKQPVYVYESEEGIIRYLHYTQDDTWVVSTGAVIPSGRYMCEEKDLLECIHGMWQVEKEHNDVEWVETDPRMTVKACGNAINLSAAANKGKGQNIDAVTAVFATLTVIVAAVIVVLVYFVVYKRDKSKVDRAMIEIEEEDEDEIEVEADADAETCQHLSSTIE